LPFDAGSLRREIQRGEEGPLRLFLVMALSVTTGIAPAFAMTCTEAVSRCIAIGADKPYIMEACKSAGAFCMKNGRFIGPASGTHWDNVTQK
jgi:hypothetical protein